ncbi:FecR domain-containing protein [Reichenbachiella sp.]|uniref:FecR family protein n=1 Tax=Reichenbachiella sp. TaxID=2184521 RepID=UPI00329875FB
MTKIKQIIDFEILQKKINNTISVEEDLIFKNWLEDDQANLTYFENAQKYYQDGSHFDQNSIDNEKAWSNVSTHLTTKSVYWKKVSGFVMATAAAVALLLISYRVVYNPDQNHTEVVDQQQEIVPGKAKAILTLSDGTRQSLNEEQSLETEIDGTKILSDGKSISYANQAKALAELKYNLLDIAKGGEYFLQLSDGTKVWLNAETTLKYPVQFIGDNRTVELVGEAYFEVAHDKNKPFYVKSDDQTIRVLGTSFNVSSYPNDEDIITTLLEGSVSVSGSNNESVLAPNEQSRMNRISGEIGRRVVEGQEFVLWKSGKFYFQNKSMVEIMKILERWYDIEVFYDNEAVKNVKLTGGFQRYEDFEKVKMLIETTETVKMMVKGKTVILK